MAIQEETDKNLEGPEARRYWISEELKTRPEAHRWAGRAWALPKLQSLPGGAKEGLGPSPWQPVGNQDPAPSTQP